MCFKILICGHINTRWNTCTIMYALHAGDFQRKGQPCQWFQTHFGICRPWKITKGLERKWSTTGKVIRRMQQVKEYMTETLILYYEKINLFLNSRLFCIVQDRSRRKALVVFLCFWWIQTGKDELQHLFLFVFSEVALNGCREVFKLTGFLQTLKMETSFGKFYLQKNFLWSVVTSIYLAPAGSRKVIWGNLLQNRWDLWDNQNITREC